MDVTEVDGADSQTDSMRVERREWNGVSDSFKMPYLPVFPQIQAKMFKKSNVTAKLKIYLLSDRKLLKRTIHPGTARQTVSHE